MKKFLLLTVGVSAFCFVECGPGVDCGPFPTPELHKAEATLTAAGTVDATPVASDLRLNLSLDVMYIAALPTPFSLIQTARACSPADPSGFDDEIALLSLTCDRSIRGFAPGQNILTTSADVFWIRQDGASVENSITLGQWLELMNKGKTTSWGDHYDEYYQWRDAYDVSIAFIPEGTDAAAGDYNFSFSMEMQSGAKYEVEFTLVTLAAL